MNRKVILFSILALLAIVETNTKVRDYKTRSLRGKATAYLPYQNALAVNRFASGAQVELNSEGYYLLSGNIPSKDCTKSATDTGGILYISSSNVTVDLCGKSLTSSNTEEAGPATAPGIVIAADLENIIVKNGTVSSCNHHGIVVNDTCQAIKLEDLDILGCSSDGINIGNTIFDLTLDNVNVVDSTKNGITLGTGCENIKFNNVDVVSPASIGITIGSSAKNIKFEHINIVDPTDAGITFAGVDNASLKNIDIVSSGGDAIGFTGASKNLMMENINIATSSTQGIDITNSCENIKIKNAEIGTTTCEGILVGTSTKGLQIIGVNIIEPGCQGIKIGGSSQNISIKDGSIVGAGLESILFNGGSTTGISGGKIENVSILSGSGATNTTACGIKLSYCDNVNVINSEFNEISANTTSATDNINTFGAYVTSCTGCSFENCRSIGNLGGGTCAGFFVDGSSVGNIFKNCVSFENRGSGATSSGYGLGFYVDTSDVTIFENCTASSNIGTGIAAGFYLNETKATDISNCEASRNICYKSGDTTAASNGTAYGLYMANALTLAPTGNTIQNSKFNSNTSGSNLLDVAAGIKIATAQAIKIINSEASNNSSSAGTCYGIYLTGITTGSSIIGNNIYGNHGATDSSSNGILEDGLNSTSLYLKNVSFGHGTTAAPLNYTIRYTTGTFSGHSTTPVTTSNIEDLAHMGSNIENIEITT